MLKSYLKVLKPVVGLAAMNEQVKLLRDVVKSLDDAERSYYAGYVVTGLVYFEGREFLSEIAQALWAKHVVDYVA